jgi:hypothetical protein
MNGSTSAPSSAKFHKREMSDECVRAENHRPLSNNHNLGDAQNLFGRSLQDSKMFVRCFVIALFALSASDAQAATIEVSPLGSSGSGLVTITGHFDLGDSASFRIKTASLSKAVVALASDGGNLDAGTQIGEAIRLKGFLTLVPDGARCASACALAWLGGTRRLMGKSAQVGFHSAADVSTGGLSGSGDALIGAYLNKIGLSENAIVYMTQKTPNEIQWLTLSDAVKIGVDVELYRPNARTKSTTSSKPAPKKLEGEPTIVQQNEQPDHRTAVNTYCSIEADKQGLHGLARWEFREQCKARDVSE